MPAFHDSQKMKTQFLDDLSAKSSATIPNVLLAKPVAPGEAARSSGSFINDILPPQRDTNGEIAGVPYSLIRQASDLEKTMPTTAARLSWTRSFIESIRPGADLSQVSSLLARFKFDRAYIANAQYLTEKQKAAVDMVRELVTTMSKSPASWRQAINLTANSLIDIEDADPLKREGLDEARMFAAATEGSVNRMNNNELKKNMDSVAWIGAELAYTLLDPWWKKDGEAVLSYSRVLLELVRAC